MDVGIEEIAFQKVLGYSLRDDVRFKKNPFHITTLKPGDRNKDQRIKGLQPLYQNKKVFHRKEIKLNPYLEEELLKFPYGRRDDLIDCFSMGLDYFVAPARPRQEKRYHNRYLY